MIDEFTKQGAIMVLLGCIIGVILGILATMILWYLV